MVFSKFGLLGSGVSRRDNGFAEFNDAWPRARTERAPGRDGISGMDAVAHVALTDGHDPFKTITAHRGKLVAARLGAFGLQFQRGEFGACTLGFDDQRSFGADGSQCIGLQWLKDANLE